MILSVVSAPLGILKFATQLDHLTFSMLPHLLLGLEFLRSVCLEVLALLLLHVYELLKAFNFEAQLWLVVVIFSAQVARLV